MRLTVRRVVEALFENTPLRDSHATAGLAATFPRFNHDAVKRLHERHVPSATQYHLVTIPVPSAPAGTLKRRWRHSTENSETTRAEAYPHD